ncbi:MAG: metallophosphoesterase, partial [Spirosoma sp.]|nr:metallophosphoesterase [Spirosoma sp.]
NNMTAGEKAGNGKHSQMEEYYSFDHGNIHFVSLDTYGYETASTTEIFPSGSKQLEWLKGDLDSARKDSRIKWTVVFFHHPPYTMGSKNSDTDPESINVRAKLVNIMDAYKVDLVLTGHSHTYERSRPLNGHTSTSSTFSMATHNAPPGNNGRSSGTFDKTAGNNGDGTGNNADGGSCFYYKNGSDPKNYTVYVVNGSGGGLESYPPTKRAEWPHKAMQQSHYLTSGSMYIEVEDNRLDAKFIDENQAVIDQFTIIKDSNFFAIPPTDNTTRQAVCECTGLDGWTHYTDDKANLLLSIKKNGNNIGKAWDNLFDLKLQGQPGATLLSYNVQPNDYLKATTNLQNRYWTLKATNEIPVSNPVSIRHYWKKVVDFSGFQNAYYGPYGAMYDYSYQTIVINDDCGLPVSYERNPVKSTLNGTVAYGHYAIPKAPSYTANGAWVYKNGSAASSSTFRYGVLPGTDPAGYMYIADYSEFVVGRLKCIGGTIAGLFGPYDQTGNARIAALEAEGANVMVYPNPTLNGKVFFNPALAYQSYQLIDMQGKVLKQEKRAGSLEVFDLSAFPPGAYILVSEGEAKTERFKIIKNQ